MVRAASPAEAEPLVAGSGRACCPASFVGFFDGAVQPHLDQMQHAPINNPARYRLQEVGMWKVPK